MNCTSCESDNTQKLSVVFNSGTSVVNTTTNTAGVGIGSGLSLGIGGAKSNTTGVSQTNLGAMAAPPMKKSYKAAVILFLFTFIFLGKVLIPWILALGLLIFWMYKIFQYNRGPWVTLYNEWEQTWFCNKCGNTYQH